MRRPPLTPAVALVLVALSGCAPQHHMSGQQASLEEGYLNRGGYLSREGYLARPEYAGTRVSKAPAGKLECVAYVRERTGLEISGDAWTWWRSAGVLYKRSHTPKPDSVLVLKRTGKLPQGHVAVVRSVINSREIRVDHANWDDRRTRGRIYEDMSVVDVSPRNDWTALRFWNGASYGRTYAAYGFIGPNPASDVQQASR